MGRTYAGILGPLAFTTILARSMFDTSSVESTMMLATICLFLFAGIGFLVGQVADSIVLEAVKANFDKELQVREAAEPNAR
ncbi:MAG TPA: hypothetical protein P5307_30110 [Pirellulaceae bacterium]|nr:hypothetical protein [Planctomycetales bacterium]HRX83371.1 hypothetical protein [Pirellulaceae bacterium]